MKKCPKIPLQCPDCKGKKFSDVEGLKNHLRKDCVNVEIECDTCNEKFSRAKFNLKHKCITDTLEFRKIIADQKVRMVPLRTKNTELKANVDQLNGQMAIKKSMHGQKAYIDKLIKK
jgi:hypothetical protein